MMSERDYLKPPEEVNLDDEERAIQRAGTIAFVANVVAFVGAYYGLNYVVDFPTGLSERLAFAAIASVFVLVWVLIGVMMVSTGRRQSAEDIGGSAAGPPSDQLAIKAAFLQNTLEQAVLSVGFFAGLAALAGGPWLALICVAVVFFAVGRILFYRGYPEGAKGRALGMTLTMLPTILGYLVVLGLLVAHLLG